MFVLCSGVWRRARVGYRRPQGVFCGRVVHLPAHSVRFRGSLRLGAGSQFIARELHGHECPVSFLHPPFGRQVRQHARERRPLHTQLLRRRLHTLHAATFV